MISERTKALLSAATTIYAGFAANPTGPGPDDGIRHRALEDAYALLAAIEQREKQNAPTSRELAIINCTHGFPQGTGCSLCPRSV